MRSRILTISMAALALTWGAACSKKPADNTTQQSNAEQSGAPATDNSQNGSAAGNAANTGSNAATAQNQPAPAPQPIVVPEGTVVSVRLGDAVGSKISTPGSRFSASLAEPISAGGQTVAPAGARASGTVVDAQSLGHFKGGARLQLTLDSIEMNGKRYNVKTSSVSRTEKGKGKRSAAVIGGGAGLGAIIGGIAGGGKGAAIGALAGGGAGTAGAAYTGNKEIVIPAETVLSFKLLQSVDVTQ